MFASLAATALLAMAAPVDDHVTIACDSSNSSAFAVAPNRLVTAYHVSRGRNCTVNGGYSAEHVESAEGHDFSIMETRSANLTPSRTSCEPMRAGETYIIEGIRRTYSVRATGRYVRTVSGSSRFSHMAQLEGTVPIGTSGGPVLNSRGEVVAIVSSATDTHVYVKELADTSICSN